MSRDIAIPKEIKQQVIDVIDRSGVSAYDFLKELIENYGYDHLYSENIINYDSYYDSFVD